VPIGERSALATMDWEMRRGGGSHRSQMESHLSDATSGGSPPRS
jgi:hypothetical protein